MKKKGRNCLMFSVFHRITQCQHGRGWKGSMKVIWSDPPAQALPARAGCPGPHQEKIHMRDNIFEMYERCSNM